MLGLHWRKTQYPIGAVLRLSAFANEKHCQPSAQSITSLEGKSLLVESDWAEDGPGKTGS